MTELVKQTNTEVATIISVISKAASDPLVDVAKLEKLLDMQERIMSKQAEAEFNNAMADLQPKLPQIERTKQGHNNAYAPYDEIHKIIMPLYTNAGFSVSFNSKASEGKVTYYGTVKHRSGHSETASIELPSDNSGGKNAIQAVASTISYAKRYLVSMLFNIVTKDEDLDGSNANDFLPNDLAVEIDLLVTQTKADKVKFLKFMKAESIPKILNRDYVKAKMALEDKKKKVAV